MMNEADVLDPEFNSKNWNLEQGITSVRKYGQLGRFPVSRLFLFYSALYLRLKFWVYFLTEMNEFMREICIMESMFVCSVTEFVRNPWPMGHRE